MSPIIPVPSEQIKLLTAGLEKGLAVIDKALQRGDTIDVQFSGSTYVSVLVRGDLLLASNVGDSRAIIGQRSGD
jgi:serine/threonine protein phosphatase PrpC